MEVYVGQTRSRALVARLAELGIGECTTRAEVPPRRHPWFLDNGAFGDWRAKRPFDSEAFALALQHEVVRSAPPAFVVCPDQPASGLESLRFSQEWLGSLRSVLLAHTPVYLVTQDGQPVDAVRAALPDFDGLFVGGTLPWKIATGSAWANLAHEVGKPCHVGRVGTAKRIAWAYRIGADSIDSSLPLWSKENMAVFLRALASPQLELAL